MADRSLRCSVQTRALGASPAGSASSAPTFVLVETPLPWPHDVADHPLLAPLTPVLKAHGARLQALVPDSAALPPAARSTDPRDEPPAPPAETAVRLPGQATGSSAAASTIQDGVGAGVPAVQGGVRVIVYRQPEPGVVRAYVRAERLVPTDDLVETVSGLLAATAEPRAPSDGVRDVLVCTHGSRDVCCGSDGMGVYQALKAMNLPGVRVWRTSHTGGHRYAPTAVTFPDGRAWAWVDADLLAGIVTRSVTADTAAGHDRGGAALPDPFAQAADTAVLATEGWPWLDRPRTVAIEPVNGDTRRLVTLASTSASAAADSGGPPPGPRPDDPAGEPSPVTYQAEVVLKRTLPVPECGRPLDEARKSTPEVEVLRLDRLSPGSSR